MFVRQLFSGGFIALVVVVAALVAVGPSNPPDAAADGPTIGENSCDGAFACTGNTGNVGDDSCVGDFACNSNSGDVGDDSCNES